MFKKRKCPSCGSEHVTRFQWAEQFRFQYWTCWDCNRIFVVDNEEIEYVEKIG